MLGQPNRLQVVQINLHHSRVPSVDLLRFMDKERVDVALIQEPWIVGDRVRGLNARGYHLLVPQTVGKSRTCIVVRAGLNVLFSSRYSSSDLTVALCERRNGANLYLASAYLPYEEEEPPSDNIKALIQHAMKEGTDVVLGCDANAHHTLWGSTGINKRGESLLEFVLFSSLVVCNRGDHPTFRNKSRAEVIDITLATNSDSLTIDNWHVSDECSFSDHYRILFEIRWPQDKAPPFRNARRTDWDKFSRHAKEFLLNHPVGQLRHPGTLEKATQTVTDVLCKAFLKSCPISRVPKSRQQAWWTTELRQIRKETRRLFNRAKDRNTDSDWTAYRLSFNMFKKMCRKAKRDSWAKFCEDLCDLTLRPGRQLRQE